MIRTSEVTASLVRHLESSKTPTMVFTEIALDGDWGSSGRLDAVALRFGSRRSITIDGYEVKVSRADFAKDVDTMKHQKYARAVDRMHYAVPVGLVRKEEVPPGIGLLTVSPGGRWQTVVRPTFVAGQRAETGQLVRMLRRIHEDRVERERRRVEDPRLETAARIVALMDKAQDLASTERRYRYWLSAGVRARIAQLEYDERRAATAITAAEAQAQRIIGNAQARANRLAAAGPTLQLVDRILALTQRSVAGRGGWLHLTDDDIAPVLAALAAAEERASERPPPPPGTA